MRDTYDTGRMLNTLYRLRSTWICFRHERLGLRAAWAKAGWIWGGD